MLSSLSLSPIFIVHLRLLEDIYLEIGSFLGFNGVTVAVLLFDPQQHKDAKQDGDEDPEELSVSLSPLFLEFDLFELFRCAFLRISTAFLDHALGSNRRSIKCLYAKS